MCAGNSINVKIIVYKWGIKIKVPTGLFDFCFFVYIVTELAFSHTLIGRIGLVLFVISVALLCLTRMAIKGSYYFVFAVLFIIYNWVNVQIGNSIVPLASLDILRTLILNFVLLLALYNYVIAKNNPIKVLKLFVYATFMVTFVLVLVSLPTIYTHRLGSAANINSNVMGIYASIAFLISFYLMLNSGLRLKNLNWLILIWFLSVVLLTGSRKGLLIVLLGTVVLVYNLFPKKRIRNVLLISMFIIAVYLLIMEVPTLYNIVGVRIDALIDFAHSGILEEASLKSRHRFIEQGWKYFLLNPWVGYGLNSFRYFVARTYSHNNFIEILISGGIIAFVLYYANYVITLVLLYLKTRNKNPIMILMFTVVLVMLFMEYGVVTYYSRFYQNILILAIAFLKITGNLQGEFNRLLVRGKTP